MGLRDINWGLAWGVLVVAVVTFGTGVSLGRHYPAQPRGESRLLEHRLLEICAGGKPVHSYEFCQIILALDVSDVALDMSHMSQGTCPRPKLSDFATCPPPPSTRSYSHLRTPFEAPPESRTRKILSTIGTLSVYIWEFVLATTAFTYTSKVVGQRTIFALWACVPALWFFHHAPWYAIWTWYGFATTAATDLRWKLPVPRTVMFFYLCALMVVMIVWHAFWSTREVSMYLFLFVTVAVPLEPMFDFVVEKIQTPLKSG